MEVQNDKRRIKAISHMKKLSVIIVNYNSIELIKDCLRSFMKYPPKINYEIIIANNDDNIKAFNDFSANHSGIKFIQNGGNLGFSSGCNLGASIAEGEYLLFLNPDTELTSSPAIDAMIGVLEKDRSVGICGCRIINLKNENTTPAYWNNPWFFIKWIKAIHSIVYKNKTLKKFSINKGICYPDLISGAVFTIKTDDFKKINGWSDDKYWMYSEDRDICNRMSKELNKRLALLFNYEIYHAWGGASGEIQSPMLKMEMIISRHNYIYHNTHGLSRIILMFLYVFKNLFMPIVKLQLNILLFNHKKIVKYRYLTTETIKYYLKSIKRITWRSDKLDF